MHNVEYVRDLDADVRYRVSFVEDRGQVHRFVVQLETVSENQWRPVIRFDTAHGFAHCDRYGPDGSVSRHEPLPVSGLNQALTWATRKIRVEWEELLAAYRDGWP
jgi:hypothetical protein